MGGDNVPTTAWWRSVVVPLPLPDDVAVVSGPQGAIVGASRPPFLRQRASARAVLARRRRRRRRGEGGRTGERRRREPPPETPVLVPSVESAPTPAAAEYPGGSTSVARWNWRIVTTGHLNAGCSLHPLRLRRRRRRDGGIVVISSARSVLLASMPSYSTTSPRRGTTSCSRPVLSSRIDVVLRRDARFALRGWIRRRVEDAQSRDGRRMDTQERHRQLAQFIQRRNSGEDRIEETSKPNASTIR